MPERERERERERRERGGVHFFLKSYSNIVYTFHLKRSIVFCAHVTWNQWCKADII